MFYKTNYQRLIFAAVLVTLLVIAQSAAVVYIFLHPPQPIYFMVDRFARVIPDVPLSKANLSDDEIKVWAAQSMKALYEYNFVNYRRSIRDMANFFTKKGWRTFSRAFSATNNVKTVRNEQFVVTARFKEEDVIIIDKRETGRIFAKGGVLAQHVPKDRYYWVVKVPFTMVMQNSKKLKTFDYEALILILRVPSTESTHGVGIEQFIASEVDS